MRESRKWCACSSFRICRRALTAPNRDRMSKREGRMLGNTAGASILCGELKGMLVSLGTPERPSPSAVRATHLPQKPLHDRVPSVPDPSLCQLTRPLPLLACPSIIPASQPVSSSYLFTGSLSPPHESPPVSRPLSLPV